MWLVCFAIALADPAPYAGEQMAWEVRFGEVVAGAAWTSASTEGDALILEAGARNAPWYARLYTLDDALRSTWVPGEGSRRYQTRSREGDFHRDDDMRLTPAGITVDHDQKFEHGDRTWTDTYPASPQAEDPLSALYRARHLPGDGPWSYPVFTGRKTADLHVEPLGAAELESVFGPVDTLVIALRSGARPELGARGAFVLWLTDDDRRVPVRAELTLPVGRLRAELVGYRAPDGQIWGTPEPAALEASQPSH